MSGLWIFGLIVVSLLYALIVLRLRQDWAQLEMTGNRDVDVSIVIAPRNEEKNLATLFRSLERLEYPRERFEVILVDDHSEDGSHALCEDFAKKSAMNVKVLQLTGRLSGKKNALEHGIKASSYDYILVTDADCEVVPKWITAMQPAGDWDFVSGPVMYKKGSSWFSPLLQLDLAALIALGGSRIRRGQPVLANGANMMFSKKAFDKVGGYSGNLHIASGDDVFLMKSIAAKGGKVAFQKSKDALVQTNHPESWTDLVVQRMRWARKTQMNITSREMNVPFLLVLCYLFYTLFVVYTVFNPYQAFIPAVITFLFKYLVDLLFFGRILKFFKRGHLLSQLWYIELLHPMITIYLALRSLKGSFEWKGRRYDHG